MAENKKQGYMQGQEFFSAAMPQGEGGKLKFDPMQADTILAVLRSGVTPEQVIAAQELMVRLGYLDPGMDDTHLGEKTMGAARRYSSNYSSDLIMETLKKKFDSIFGD
tara:strand:- start:130 stop:453 length:324 start_codon:yes stop_codon:yes gene_type:complete